ncbi:MAG: ankyrin [Limisphaerales bacterium]|nr:MAG: ankyrin [Limisphaerales bacterium]KAG0510057.1 MAG: ankyrin [Limisphaerales bacterium]TXT52900.1 MAG: ankyrin [Limisphaerales bacterium]
MTRWTKGHSRNAAQRSGSPLNMSAIRGNTDFEYDLAIRQNNVRRLQTLKRHGIPPCEAAVLLALKNKHPGLVPLLVEAGANVDWKSPYPYRATALGFAVGYCEDAVVKMLLEVGADPNLDGIAMRPLVSAATDGKLLVTRYLLQHGADANGQNPDTGLTALIQAVTYDYTEITELLLDAGADPHHRGPLKFSALEVAEKEGKAELASLLRASGRTKSKSVSTSPRRRKSRLPRKQDAV